MSIGNNDIFLTVSTKPVPCRSRDESLNFLALAK